jgi:hypothetical protein
MLQPHASARHEARVSERLPAMSPGTTMVRRIAGG